MVQKASVVALLNTKRTDGQRYRGGPTTLHDIEMHDTKKQSHDVSFDARSSWVHFAHHGIKNVVNVQELMEKPSVRNCLHRSAWFDRPSMVALRKVMRGTIVSTLSLASLVAALFFGDLFEFMSVPNNTLLDFTLTLAFLFFTFELTGNALSDRKYLLSFFFFMDILGTFSMVFDISCILGPDATVPERLKQDNGGSSSVIIVRAARAARIGARAGRLSRVAKIMRFFGGGNPEDEGNTGNVRMAKVISNKLGDVLSIRVAFLVICIAVVMPSFSIFEYPEMEESLTAWTGLLSQEAEAAFAGGDVTKLHHLNLTLRRFSNFYEKTTYGPFMACYLKEHAASDRDALFNCGKDSSSVRLPFATNHTQPQRGAFVLTTSTQNLALFFDMSAPQRLEALMGMSLIGFIIIVMVVFSMILTDNIATVALVPLERMLSAVRQQCAEIFKYTKELQDIQEERNEEEDEDNEDDEEANEFALLEKAVAKLGAIASLSAGTTGKLEEDMTENDIMVMNWVQGRTNVSSSSTNADRGSVSSEAVHLRLTSLAGADMNQDSILEGIMQAVPREMLDLLRTADFDAWDATADQKLALSAYIMQEHEDCKDLVSAGVGAQLLVNFVAAAEQAYSEPNAFHNFSHALDTLYTVSWYLSLTEAKRCLSETQQLSLMVAALGHDVGHVGVNNAFLVETSHELALTYNDRSPLENLHCSKLFQILGERETNIFRSLKKEAYKELRRQIIEAILHTDVTKHNDMVKELTLLYQMNNEAFDSLAPTQQGTEILKSSNQMMMNALLHCADVCNPMKPWSLAQKLAYLCMEEFFAQGDKEKALGIPVQMLNDRDKVNRANSQIGFQEFMLAPFVEALVLIFPPLDNLAFNLGKNIQMWETIWREEVDPPPDQVSKMSSRVQRVVAKMNGLLRE
eukprot:TRINITY_DN102853_c0_g1_i1.p1 TRINITY_DN102853_c0_g1~~TRINITY_DN102853_c0_g1_i1.p1  ORF type:complete len:914 (+),score=185.84 TRINITY_DN102853_c0_g1_i1:133-2874(+)